VATDLWRVFKLNLLFQANLILKAIAGINTGSLFTSTVTLVG